MTGRALPRVAVSASGEKPEAPEGLREKLADTPVRSPALVALMTVRLGS